MNPDDVRLKNLKSVKPGEVRNPKGKKKGTLNSSTIIRQMLESKETIMDPIKRRERKATQMEIMLMKMLELARKGNMKAVELLLDRLEGKPKQVSEIQVPGGIPVSFSNLTDEELKEQLRRNMEILNNTSPTQG